MGSYQAATFRTPWGVFPYLRSTQDVKTESYTFAHDSLPTQVIDGHEQKVLPKGAVLAVITSGDDAGKVGVFQDAGSGADEVQTLTESGTISGGTFDLTFFDGTGGAVTLSDIAFDVTAADLQAAVRAVVATSSDQDYAGLADDIVVTGGPIGTTPFTITYNGSFGIDVPQVVADDSNLTGTTPGITVATTVAGVEGAIDGRGDTANIVGFNNTELPWQLLHRDVEVAVVYEAAVVQANCVKLNAAGEYVVLDDTTRDAMDVTTKTRFTFH